MMYGLGQNSLRKQWTSIYIYVTVTSTPRLRACLQVLALAGKPGTFYSSNLQHQLYLLCKICTTTAMSRLSEVRPAALRCVFERARRSLTAMDVQYGWVERTATTILFGGRAQTAEVAARQNCVRRHLQVLCAAVELSFGEAAILYILCSGNI